MITIQTISNWLSLESLALFTVFVVLIGAYYVHKINLKMNRCFLNHIDYIKANILEGNTDSVLYTKDSRINYWYSYKMQLEKENAKWVVNVSNVIVKAVITNLFTNKVYTRQCSLPDFVVSKSMNIQKLIYRYEYN